ncbi:MAG: hypothetical protein FWD06_10690 [Oscillospiraceae bacterium]|nr:hypothetical protein [Oscillospiraceae bacterium]
MNLPKNKDPTETTQTTHLPVYDCTSCCYIFGKSGRVCGVCIKKILAEHTAMTAKS